MNSSQISALHSAIQDAAAPGVWSRGVQLAKSGSVFLDRLSEDETLLRVRSGSQIVFPQVSLWPSEGDWFCNCESRQDPCPHVAAAIIAVKTEQFQKETKSHYLCYRLKRVDRKLSLERWIVHGGTEKLLTDSLVALVGGVGSGRVKGALPPVTQSDFRIDQELKRRTGVVDSAVVPALVEGLSETAFVTLDGQPVRVVNEGVQLVAVVSSDDNGFRLKIEKDFKVDEVFENGFARTGEEIRFMSYPKLSPAEVRSLSGVGGGFFPKQRAQLLAAEVIPALKQKMKVEIRAKDLPVVGIVEPRIELKFEETSSRNDEWPSAVVTPRLVYGDPPVATVENDRLVLVKGERLPLRNRFLEGEKMKQLKSEMLIEPTRATRLEGVEIIEFVEKAIRFNWKIEGRVWRKFEIKEDLQSRVEFEGEFPKFFFEAEGRKVDAEKVLLAWEEGWSFFPLQGQTGWARTPVEWLEKHGKRLKSMVAAKRGSPGEQLPQYWALELADFCETIGVPIPDTLQKLRDSFSQFSGIPQFTLPDDMTAKLRSYQQIGVNWLGFLRDQKLGGVLADDMGLGKTLQAISVIQGRTLIVCPASVVPNWVEQLSTFRPNLSHQVFHGAGRKLDENVDVVITTYSLLRIDYSLFLNLNWDIAILDEAQMIKNPDSQVAQVAHQLRAQFKLVLTGTPIENRMEDLWSQFQFALPGFLGERSEFRNEHIGAIANLKKKVSPFILRRLKGDVLKELPPKTEVTLYSEMTDSESELYQAVLASSRKEVLEELGEKASVFAVLERLLRLRQICCHPALLPGQSEATSSKVDLLLGSLENSIQQGHRALVFSQWTALLDLLEPRLNEKSMTFSRLDGSTSNRGKVISDFQKEDGPKVMLISLKAGGVGVTLTAADHVYFMDPWWNPTVEDQAADRVHRIGQKRSVLVHRLVSKGTIEEKVIQLQKKKKELASAILDGTGDASISLTREDLLALLSD